MKSYILQDMTKVFTETAFIRWAFTVFWENLIFNYSLVKPAIQLLFTQRQKPLKLFLQWRLSLFSLGKEKKFQEISHC